MKHKHFDLIQQFYSDTTQKVWEYAHLLGEWIEVTDDPLWVPEYAYAIGDEMPTEPPVVEVQMGELSFPLPDGHGVANGEIVWLPNMIQPDMPIRSVWPPVYNVNGFTMAHKSREAAEAHALALRAFNDSAVIANQFFKKGESVRAERTELAARELVDVMRPDGTPDKVEWIPFPEADEVANIMDMIADDEENPRAPA